MDNGNNFDFASNTYDSDFIDNLNAEGRQWEPYRSAAASSSGDEFPMYSSLEGEFERGYSIYGDQNYLNIELDANMSNYSNMSLPIPTSSPRGSPASDRSPSVDNEMYNLSKCPRSPVAADLDTANILPIEHRHKRIKPARVRQ